MEPHHFGRERQVLDRGPAGDNTELRDVVVRVAAEIRRLETRIADPVGSTILALGSGEVKFAALIADSGPAAEQTARPVWIPVVVVRTAETKGFRQLQAARNKSKARNKDRKIDRIRGRAETDALERTAATAVHREAG